MPAELLHEEAEVVEVPRKNSELAAVQQAPVRTADQQTTDQEAPDKKSKSIWRKIFEGHEEMLGWTPD